MSKTAIPENVVRFRHLFLRIISSLQYLNAISPHLHFLDEHFPQHKLEKALKALIEARLIGREFIAWFDEVCEGSQLQMHKELLEMVDREEVGRVIAGQNFVV